MFTCLWQLWDWLDPPLFTTATMESKKLQQLQQANSHLAPMPQTKAPSYQMATGGGGGGNDYRQARSPVFHNHPQYQSLASNFAQINLTNHQNPLMGGGAQQAQPQQQQQQHSSDHLHNKNLQNLNTNLLNSSDRLGYATTPQQQQPHSQLSHNLAHYHGEQIYQSNSLERERLYQQPPLRTHYPNSHSHVHPTNRLQQQYQLLQQEKMQQQLKTQNDAYVQQQQTFALRQQLNPPLPSQSHYHMQSQSQTPIHIPAQMQQQQQQQQQQHQQQQQQQQQLQQHQLQSQQLSQQQQLQLQQQQQQHHHSRNIPPSSLNLTTHFQPAPGPIQMKNNKQQQQQQQQQSQYATSNPLHHHAAISQNLLQNARLQQSQAIYQQNQQIQQQIIHKQMQQQSPQTNQIIIQQNNPGQVVNQACQTQIAGVSSSQKSSKGMNSSSSSTPSSTHPPLERKKSEPIHALKSPVTKRHPAAAVTLSGWLYKQGSEGLKVWRKRWFVLADYCLFYYKSQEEEKLLGSVLLPSYRISACLPEDKVVRKYAFKCEHTNMRTYWLAAETAESMIHWVRALTLATMMQGSSESESQPSPLSLNENSDSGIHTFQSQQSKLSVPAGPLTPASDGGNGGGGAGNGGGVQPLYANAPPKPRRATDGGYSSPSPENSIEKYDSHYDVQMQRQQQQQHNLSHQQAKSPIPSSDPIYESRQKNALSAMNEMRQQTMKSPDPSAAMRLQQTRIDNNKSPHVARQNMKSPYPPENLYVQEPMRNGPQSTNPVYPNEQYRGENIIRAPQKFTDDYNQTIYGEKVSDRERELYLQKMMIQQAQAQQLQLQQQQQQQQQQRFTPSMSGSLPFNYQNAERRTPDTYGPPRAGQDRRNFSDYEDIYNLAAQANQPADAGSYRRPMSPVRYNNNTQIPNMPTRYTPNYMEPPTAQHIQMRARPAQSMVPRPHSADFLEYEARNPETTRMRAEPARAPRPKSSLDINRTPDNYYYSEASYAEKMRQSASYLQKQNTMPGKVRADDYSDRLKDGENNNLQSASSSNTIPRESDFERANRLGLNTDDIQGAASVPRVHRPNAKNFPNQQELFLRSASARLPRKDDEPNVRDGERKREESMKRLLEWKQRMLQSPLTRKISQQMPSGAMMSVTAQPTTPTMNLSNKSPVPQKMMSQGGSGGSGVGGIQRSRSETNANTGYNSYSSDDEDGPQLSPAGRSSHIPCTINSNNTNIVTSITTASLTSNLISSHSTNNNNDMIKYPIINPKESIHPAATGNTLNMKSLSTPMTTVPPVPPTKPTTPKPLLPGTPGRSSPGTSGSVSHSLSTETNAPYVPVYKRNLSSFKSAAATSSMLSMQHTTTIPSPVKAFQIVSESAAVVKAADPTIEDDTYDGNVTLTEDVGDVKTTNPPTDLTSDLDSNFGNENDEADEDDEVDDDDKTFEYTDDDLDEALYAENEYEKSKVLDEEPRTPTIVAGDANLEEDISESHYVPMTPKKTPSTSESSIAAMDILNSIRNSSSEIIEENPYIEMTQGTMKSILADDSKSAYEMIMVSNKKADSEPLYMELTQLQNVPDLSLNSMNSNSANSVKTIVSDGKTTIKKSTLKRHSDRNSMKKKARNDLPDILKPSQNNYMRSDSSDADDEASKDFDSMDMKSRTRFSLSDTFRPASYYLGASTPLNECIDSSDSEIVSPPPIPKSPPPMDELKTEEIFSSENYDTVKRREKQMSDGSSFEQIPKVHSSNQSLNMGKTSSPSDGHRSSRLSLQDQMYNKQMPAHKLNSSEYLIGLSKYKMENNDVISGSNYSFNTDDGSNTSSDYDMYNKIKMESPSYSGDSINQSNSSLSQKYQNDSETDSIELRNSEISRLNMEMKKKRRPLSEDSFSEIESMGNFDETISSVNLDQYLNKLESSDLYLYPNTAGTSNEQNNWINNSLTQINEIHFIQPPEVFRTEHDNEIYYENIQLTNQKLENVALMKSKFHIDVSEVHAPSSIRSISALSSNGTYYDSLEDQNDQMKQKAGDANLTSLSMLREKNLSLHDAQCESEDLKVAAVTRISNIEIAESVTMSTVDLDQQSSCTAFDLTQPSPIHSRGNSNVSDSAPYYYSDIASRNSSNQDENPNGSLNSSGGSNSLTQQKLNNQRDVSLKKIAGISHIHNPINKRSQQLQSLQPMQEGHSSQSTSENRTISVDILNVADKDRGIDIRNLYETDRLDKNINKSVETSFTNKIYFNDKFTNHHNSNQMNMNNNCNVNNNRLSGNGNQSAIEGMLINNSLSPIAVKPINTSMESSMFARNSLNNSVHSHNSSNADNISYTSKNSDMSAGDELWEEDAIWSESLRRVSHRHAQSMDDLDRINPGQTMASVTGSTPTPPICLSNSRNSDASDKEWNHHQQQQHQHQQLNKLRTSSKISRDVIYVNDESIYRTNPRKKNSSISSSGSAASAAAATGVPKSVLAGSSKKGIKFNDDNDVYVQLAVDNNNDNNSDVYETLRTDGNSAGAGAITGAVGGHGGSVGASSSSGGRSSGGGGGNLKPSFDTIDRENIRQWDLMSSGLMKSSISGHIVAGSSGAGSGGSGGSVGGSSSNGGGSGGGNEASTSMGHGGVVVEAANVAASAVKGSLGGVMDSKKMKYIGMEQTGGRLTDEGSSTGTPASISVRNVKNIPKVHLTVKPEPSDPIDTNPFRNMSMNNSTSSNNNINNMNSPFYHHTDNYLGKSAESSTKDIYAQVQKNNAINLQHHHQHSASQLMHTPTDQPWSPSVHKSGSQKELNMLERENVQLMRNLGLSLDMSAGDLLNRTHEELVLLLIQLRRQNSTTARAIEQCCTDIHEVQNRIRTADGPSRAENISRLDSLKQHLAELEKQYEKSKPLVNLVDNMVKLGSLYRGGQGHGRQYPTESVTLDRLEFNQRVQERRLLQEERKHWDRLSPNQTELQTKVQQLYQLDQLLQEESGTLQSLQRDKEDLERALGGLRAKMQNENAPPVAIEAARRQQHALERELSRVHLLLAENSKKLEQTVASNARLEQELLVLRQKLQASRDARGSQSALGSQGDSIPYTAGATAVLESELRRVQQLVGDMQRQRQELSLAVRQLTDNSNSLYQQMNTNGEYSSSHIKKRSQITSWTETDLDSMVSVDHSLMNKSSENLNSSASTTPLYIDTGNGGSMANTSANILNCSSSSKISQNGNNNNYYNYRSQLDSDLGVESSGMESGDDLIESSAFSNLSSQDKQEIKTVRIVKRESERRHRDRERSGTSVSSQNLDQVLEEESSAAHHQYQQYDDYNNYTRTKSLPRTYMETHEIYRQTGTNDSRKEEKQSIYSSNSSIPNNNNNVNINNNNTKYSDYYASQSANTNHYPVSMIDRKADLYTDYCNNSNGSMSNGDGKTVYNNYVNGSGPGLKQKTESIQSLTKTIGELSPVFQSEAAKQIIIEISGNTSEENEKIPLASKQRRAVPKEKRRHFTAPHHLSAKSMQILQTENDMNKNNINWRARDDLDMEVALRPRINAPDVVRSALGPREKISENTIDKLFGAPNKILIPERYVPEQPPELSPEEKKRRQEKVEVIKKMLSETPTIAGNDSASVPPTRAEKKQREHLLQLNQILAQQVMQMSKIVAEKAMAVLPSKVAEFNEIISEDDDQSSPGEPLPLYQQRDNYFT